MVDIRRDFDNLLRRWGHDIILQRRTSPHDGGDPVYDATLEKHTVRNTYPASRGLPTAAQEGPEGIWHGVEMVFYFRHEAAPTEGDRIYDNIEGLPNNQTTYLVDFALAMRGYGGRIEFWEAGCTRETPN